MAGEQLFDPENPTLPDINPGTTYQQNAYSWIEDPYHAYDQRNQMYGRAPGAADAAVNRAWDTGQNAENYGLNTSNSAWAAAQAYANRAAQQGNWGQQNAALDQSMGYGQQLAGIEATQGPSAAQAQLQQGTNQALASQVALARSGSGFGGNAGAAGLAAGNLAGIQANQANNAAALRAQEDAAWRQRLAANYGSAAGIAQGVGQQYGGQAQADLGAYYQNQGQNDASALGFAGLGTDAYMKGAGLNIAGQGLGNDIRGQELGAGQAAEDLRTRKWAAQNGFTLAEAQRQDQKDAGYLAAGGAFLGNLL